MFSVPTGLLFSDSLLATLRSETTPSPSRGHPHISTSTTIAGRDIGAGSAGLAVLKIAPDISEHDNLGWNIVFFEEREDAGGIWCVLCIALHPRLPGA